MEEGKRDKRKAETDEEAAQPLAKEFGKTIIMPIAVPGVGTTVHRDQQTKRSVIFGLDWLQQPEHRIYHRLLASLVSIQGEHKGDGIECRY
jgi:hypothetical protein